MDEQEDFIINVTHWDCISEKTASLAIEQSEAILKEQLNTSKGTQEKADKLLGIIIPSATALLIFIFAGWKTDILHLTALVAFTILITSLFFVFKNLRKYEISIPGEYPQVLINDDMIVEVHKENPELQFIQLALHICQNNRMRIANNNRTNSNRIRNNEKALYILAYGIPLAPVIGFILSWVFGHCL